MAEQINQDITIPDEPPSSRDKVNFRLRADAFVAWMKVFATQMNSLIPKVNASLSWINTNVQNALSYSQTATAQAGVATTKAGEASASAAAALASKEAAEAIFDNFDDKYLGAKPTAPIVDNDGNPLTTGALYFKTTAPKGIYVYDAELSIWSSPTYVPTSHGALSGLADADAHPMSAITGLTDKLQSLDNKVILSGVAAYHIYNGKLSLANSVITNGFSTTLYTGNGSTQSINTGVDMATQWGNDASETFGGLVWLKSRSNALNNFLQDTVRGALKGIITDSTSVETSNTNVITSFNNNGVTLGNSAVLNTNLATYASWNFQTTHRVTGTTNHGKAYTCHYNPFTGFTIVKYEGSGITGHEIPHSLGRKLGFVIQKDLIDAVDWLTYNGETGSYMSINTTAGRTSDSSLNMWRDVTDTSISLGIHTNLNENGKQHILYGWANSYFDAQNNLIGNYEMGVYTGNGTTGTTIGNKVATKGKPAFVMVKRLDSTGDWVIRDNQRGNANMLFANLSSAEQSSYGFIEFSSDGFTPCANHGDINVSGATYMYLVAYDNDNGSGKSKYTKALDNPTANLNALVPFAQGIDANGTKNTIVSKNETLTGITLTQGKNYPYLKIDGTYGVSKYDWGTQGKGYNGFGDFFNQHTNKWYSGVSVFADSFETVGAWTTGTSGALSVVNGTLTLRHNGTNYPTAVNTVSGMIVGKKYCISAKLTSTNTAYNAILISVAGGATGIIGNNGFFNAIFTATQTSGAITILNQSTTSGDTISVDNLSIYPINNDGTPDLSGAVEITSRNYLDAIIYADQNGQIEYIEQLPKTNYFDKVKANEFQGKNACTAWVIIDGTVTPPAILDSYNVSAVIRTATARLKIYFKTEMDTKNYMPLAMFGGATTDSWGFTGYRDASTSSIEIDTVNAGGAGYNPDRVSLCIFGGKN